MNDLTQMQEKDRRSCDARLGMTLANLAYFLTLPLARLSYFFALHYVLVPQWNVMTHITDGRGIFFVAYYVPNLIKLSKDCQPDCVRLAINFYFLSWKKFIYGLKLKLHQIKKLQKSLSDLY